MSDATNKLEKSQEKLSEVEQANNLEDAQGKLFEVEQVNNPTENTSGRKSDVREKIPTEYEVVKGDTVYTIAHKYGLTQGQVISLNKIEDPRALKVGQKLKLRG